MNYQETLDYLFAQLPMFQRQGKTAFKKDLSNTLKLCELLDQPQQKFKSIHVAGTNGKGSVSHMLASIYQEAGYKTGLYTSPHLKDFRERIRIDGKMISPKGVIEFVSKYQRAFESIKPSFFEWTVSLAFYQFAKEKVDIAIIETGMGGRLDSTNVITPELSIITNIGLDHTEFLGDSLDKIAREKAGIIKPNVSVVVGNSSGQKNIFDEFSHNLSAPISYAEMLDSNLNLTTDLKGWYQKENLQTTLTAWLQLRKLGWKISVPQFQSGLLKVQRNTALQGRWQVLQDKPKIIIDTAHNLEGLKFVVNQLTTENYSTLHLVLGFVKEKEVQKIVSIFPSEAQYYFCQPNIPRAMNIENLKNSLDSLHLINSQYFSTVDQALNQAKSQASKSDLIFVGGSNFVVAEIL